MLFQPTALQLLEHLKRPSLPGVGEVGLLDEEDVDHLEVHDDDHDNDGDDDVDHLGMHDDDHDYDGDDDVDHLGMHGHPRLQQEELMVDRQGGDQPPRSRPPSQGDVQLF